MPKYLFVRAQIREGTVKVNEETGWNCTGFLEETDTPDEMLIFPTKKHNSDSADLTSQKIKDGLLNNQNQNLILAYAWDEDLAIADHNALQKSYDEKLHVIIGLTLDPESLTEEINDFTKHFVASSTYQLMKFAFENRQDEKILQLYDVSSVVLLQWKSNNTYYVGPSKLVLTGRMKILKDIKVLSILPNLDNSYLVNKFLYGFGNPKEMLAIRLNDPSSEENNNPWNLVGEPIFDKQRETWRVSFRVETTLTSYSKYKPMYTEDTLKIIPEDRQNLSQYTLFEGENSEYSQSFRKVVADDTVVPLFKGEALFNYEARTSTELKELSFTCCEQSMMFYKVLMFDPENKNMIDLIMDLKKKPADIKALGGKVKNFNTEFWKEINLDIIYLGNELKFTQNDDLKSKIIGVTGMGFGEISDNKTYGTGYKTLEEHDESRANWPGLNQLGELLKKLRDNIEKSDVYYNKDPNQRG